MVKLLGLNVEYQKGISIRELLIKGHVYLFLNPIKNNLKKKAQIK